MIKQKSKNFSWFDLSIGMVLSMIYYWIMTKPNTPFNIDYFSNIFLFVTTIGIYFLSIIVLNEPFNWFRLIGALIIVLGAFIVNVGK